MKQKFFEGFRIQIKGDTEANLKKAINFTPLPRELVAVLPNEECKYVRFRLGNGEANVNELPDINVQANWEQNDPTQPDYIKNKPTNISGGGSGLTEEEVKTIVQNETADKITEEETKEIINAEIVNKVDKTTLAGTGTADNAGLVYTPTGGWNGINAKNGVLTLQPASNSQIDERKADFAITPRNLDYAVNSVTEGKFTPLANTNLATSYGDGYIAVLNSDNKTSFRKSCTGVYVGAYTIPYRMAKGELYVGTATADNHATTFKQLKEYTAPIAENTRRIENLESTLLTYVEDTASDYEKAVPVGVGKYAILSSIGGASYTTKNAFNPALLDSSIYEITEDGGIRYLNEVTIDGVSPSEERPLTLNAGTWYISASGEGNLPSSFEAYGEDGTYMSVPFTLETRQTIYLRWYYEVEGIWEKPFYIMLSQTEGAPYESYFEGERHAPVTAIKSYGSNLFDYTQIFPVTEGQIEQIPTGVRVSGYNRYATLTPEQFLEMTGLKEGDTFTYSATRKAISGTWSGGSCGGFTFYGKGGYPLFTFGGSYDEGYISITKTIPIPFNSNTHNTVRIFSADNTVIDITDITITRGEVVAPYMPYSKEPIDTYTIPSEIQALDGYGKEGFVLDLDSKTATYQSKTTDVSAYLTDYNDFKKIRVEAGGMVISENPYKYAVPITLTYVKRRA